MFASATQNTGMINAKGFMFVAALVISLFTSLSAEAAVTLLSQPANSLIFEGKAASFTVNATSNRTLRYYWYKNGTMLSNKTKTLSFASVSASDAATYYCLVSDGTSKARCNAFTLTIGKPVAITKQPASLILNAGATANLTVTATGTAPLSYQWYKNGTAISGATSSSLTYTNSTTSTAGSYHVVVKNSGSSATSNKASLQIAAVVKTGSAQISWARPTTRQDGTALASTEISGYTLYHSASSATSLTKLTSLTPSELSILVSDLAAGTHYFALSTTDTKGLQSNMSSTITVSIQ